MGFKIVFAIIASIFLLAGVFVAFRFGFIGERGMHFPSVTEITENVQNLPRILRPTITATPSAHIATTSARVLVLDAPTQASTSQKFTIKWFVDNDKVATTSHTAIHFGKNSKSNPTMTSDYPEKSAILMGTIPATFSAELSIPLRGLYYYRANAIVDGVHVWSEEKTIDIFSMVQSAATSAAEEQ